MLTAPIFIFLNQSEDPGLTNTNILYPKHKNIFNKIWTDQSGNSAKKLLINRWSNPNKAEFIYLFPKLVEFLKLPSQDQCILTCFWQIWK